MVENREKLNLYRNQVYKIAMHESYSNELYADNIMGPNGTGLVLDLDQIRRVLQTTPNMVEKASSEEFTPH